MRLLVKLLRELLKPMGPPQTKSTFLKGLFLEEKKGPKNPGIRVQKKGKQ